MDHSQRGRGLGQPVAERTAAGREATGRGADRQRYHVAWAAAGVAAGPWLRGGSPGGSRPSVIQLVSCAAGGSDQAGECEARACAGPLSSPAGPLGLLLRLLDLVSEAEAPVLLCVVQGGTTLSTGKIFLK